jgi:uncharacterized oxidoreductase
MIKSKKVLITGGGSGIGEALAVQLAKDNQVIICGRSEEKLRQVSAKSENISFQIVDVADYQSVDKLFANIKERGVVLDVLFNNAGVIEVWDITTTKLTSKEIFEKVNTNLSGAIAMTQQFIQQANHAVENLIINVTSEIALFPLPILPLYATSKTGLRVFTQSLRIQLQNSKFSVIEILPPTVDTAMPKQINNKVDLMDPDTFARGVIKSVARGNLEYAPGKNALLLKIISKFFPKAGLKLVDKMSRKQFSIQ